MRCFPNRKGRKQGLKCAEIAQRCTRDSQRYTLGAAEIALGAVFLLYPYPAHPLDQKAAQIERKRLSTQEPAFRISPALFRCSFR